LRCLRTENDFTGNITVTKKCGGMPQVAWVIPKRPMRHKMAWIRSVRPAQSLCLHHYLFFSLMLRPLHAKCPIAILYIWQCP
jgi:hypothetical protein